METRVRNKFKLRICFVQPVQSPYWAERLKDLAEQSKFDLILLLERSRFDHRPGWHVLPIDGVKTEVLESSVHTAISKGDELGYRIHGIRSIPWRLLPALWRLKADVLVLCNATQLLIALPYKWLTNAKLAIIVEDTPHAIRNVGQIARSVKAWIYKQADRCFAFSEDAIQFLKNAGIGRCVERSSWSLDMSYFHPSIQFKPHRMSVQSDVSEKTVVFIGSLQPNKGVLILVRAWHKLPLLIRNRSRLLLVGSGPLQNHIEEYIQQKQLNEVSCVGQIPYNKVRDLLQASDLFILPTLQDLYSLTVLEAMACGTPVITTPFNGARELIEDEKNGWIVNPTKPTALTSVLKKALSEHTDLHIMGIEARKRVKHMDNAIVMGKFGESLYNLAVNRR